MSENKNTATKDEKPIGRSTAAKRAPKSRAKQGVSDVITGDILASERLRKRYPLVLWCVVLVFVYIGVTFYHQRLQRLEIRQRIELNEERSRAIIFSSMRVNASRHSRITEEVAKRGLQLEESTVPPKVILTE